MRKKYLTLIVGCMFSGKTDLLIKKIELLSKAEKFLVFKPKKYGRVNKNFIFSRSNVDKKIPAIRVKNGEEIQKHLKKNPDVKKIFIDEGHFFGIKFLKHIDFFLKKDYNIFFSGLDKGVCDHNLILMNNLLKIANKIHNLYAYCSKCKAKASKTQLIDENGNHIDPNFLISKEEKMINLVGGKEKYEARCSKCYFKYEWKKYKNEL